MICPRCQTDAAPAAESALPLHAVGVARTVAEAAAIAATETATIGDGEATPISTDPVVQVCGTCGQASIDGRVATYDDIRLLPITRLDHLRNISASIVEQTRRPR